MLSVNNLANDNCGLTDGSSAGDWRLPRIKELESLIHKGFANPALPDTQGTGQWTEGDPFIGVESWYHWSSTEAPNDSTSVYLLQFSKGFISEYYKNTGDENMVWPVRDGL